MVEQGRFFGECSHGHTYFLPAQHGPHHGSAVCADCGKFMGWVAKPETLKQREENAKILTTLSKMPNLPSWERHFVRDISSTKHLSPRQQKKLLEVWDFYKGKEKADDSLHGETLSPNRDPSNNV